MSKFHTHRRKKPAATPASPSPSHTSEDPWRAETPFGPPRIPSPGSAGISRLRNTFAKLSPAARAERELLKEKNRYKIPLTERNVDTFLSEQEVDAAVNPETESSEVHVSAWLERLSP